MPSDPGPVRRALLRLEPWLLGGIIVFPVVLAITRWVMSLARQGG